MKAVRLIGLTACLGALAACSDSPTTPPVDPHLAMTQASRDEATRLYNLATSSNESANTYRPLLLKALVDGLQWGVEMKENVSFNINGTDVPLRAMAMDNIITNPSSSGGFVMAWSTDNNVNTIIVVSKPYGAGINQGDFNELGFYLTNGEDTPYIVKSRGGATPGSASFTMGNPGTTCTYETQTPLVGPAASSCNDENVTADFDLSFYPNGDTNQAGVPIYMTNGATLFVGVRVVRDATLFPTTSRVLRLLHGM